VGLSHTDLPWLQWIRDGQYCVRAVGTDYAVSRSTVQDEATRAMVTRYCAWHGPDLDDQPRETARPAQLIGVCASAADAKALCELHRTRQVPCD